MGEVGRVGRVGLATLSTRNVNLVTTWDPYRLLN